MTDAKQMHWPAIYYRKQIIDPIVVAPLGSDFQIRGDSSSCGKLCGYLWEFSVLGYSVPLITTFGTNRAKKINKSFSLTV